MGSSRRILTPVLLVLLLALLAPFLSGCGAVVRSTLTINANGSGQRKIVATLTTKDLSYVTGGIPALETVIKSAIPADLSYAGSTPTGDGTSCTFILDFTSPQQYVQKINRLLAGQNVGNNPVTFVVENSAFKQGVTLKETFNSIKLLGWLADALVAKGVVDSGNRSYIFDSVGGATLIVNGVTSATTEPFVHDSMKSTPFSQIKVVTAGFGTGTYQRTISYTLPATLYASKSKAYDDWFAKATPAGGKLTKPTSGDIWTMTFNAPSWQKVVEYTNQALATNKTSFNVTTQPSDNNPLTLETRITDSSDCTSICGSNSVPEHSVVIPDSWGLQRGTQKVPTGGLRITRKATLSRAKVALDVSNVKRATGSIAMTLPKADAEFIGSTFTTYLKPSTSEVKVDKGDQETTYTVSFESPTVEQLSSQMTDYLRHKRGGTVTASMTTTYKNMFLSKHEDDFTIDVSALWDADPTQGIDYEIVLPQAIYQIDQQSSYLNGGRIDNGKLVVHRENGGSWSARVAFKAIEIGTWIVIGIAALLILGTALALGLMIGRRKRRTRRQLQAAAAPENRNGGAYAAFPGSWEPTRIMSDPSEQPTVPLGSPQQRQSYSVSQVPTPPHPQSQTTPPPYPTSQATPRR